MLQISRTPTIDPDVRVDFRVRSLLYEGSNEYLNYRLESGTRVSGEVLEVLTVYRKSIKGTSLTTLSLPSLLPGCISILMVLYS